MQGAIDTEDVSPINDSYAIQRKLDEEINKKFAIFDQQNDQKHKNYLATQYALNSHYENIRRQQLEFELQKKLISKI